MKTNGAETVFEQGIFEKTERELDFAILGKAYFAVESENEDAEEPYYTRDGSFQISATDEGNYLTTRDGHYVLSRDGDRIELEYKTVEGSNGKKQFTNELDLSGLSEVIGLYTCENPDGLVPVGKKFYTVREPLPENGFLLKTWMRLRREAGCLRERWSCPVRMSPRK